MLKSSLEKGGQDDQEEDKLNFEWDKIVKDRLNTLRESCKQLNDTENVKKHPIYFSEYKGLFKPKPTNLEMCQQLISRWKYQFSYDYWSQSSCAPPLFQLYDTSRKGASSAVEQLRRKANMVA